MATCALLSKEAAKRARELTWHTAAPLFTRELTRSVHGALQIVFALVAVLLAVGSASAARKLSAPMLPPLPIDPRAEAMAAQVTTADSLAAAVPLFSNAIWVRPRCQRQDDVWLLWPILHRGAGEKHVHVKGRVGK